MKEIERKREGETQDLENVSEGKCAKFNRIK